MARDLKGFPPMFTTPSGLSLDEPLSSLLDTAAVKIDRANVVAVGLTVVDSSLNTSLSWLLTHPSMGVHLAQRLRKMAEHLEKSAVVCSAPENNQSQRVH